jgi:hypothetical protein
MLTYPVVTGRDRRTLATALPAFSVSAGAAGGPSLGLARAAALIAAHDAKA